MIRVVPGGERWRPRPLSSLTPAGSRWPADRLPVEKRSRTYEGLSSGRRRFLPIPRLTSPDREPRAIEKAPDRLLECRWRLAIRLSELYFQCLYSNGAGSHWFERKLETLQRPVDFRAIRARHSPPRIAAAPPLLWGPPPRRSLSPGRRFRFCD